MLLGNLHCRQGRVEVLIKLNAAQKGGKVVWGQGTESEVGEKDLLSSGVGGLEAV